MPFIRNIDLTMQSELASTKHVAPPSPKLLRPCEGLCHSESRKPNVWSSTIRLSLIGLPVK
jgi:hypothetical protein